MFFTRILKLIKGNWANDSHLIRMKENRISHESGHKLDTYEYASEKQLLLTETLDSRDESLEK